MRPFLTLARTQTADGACLSLHEHAGTHYLKLDGRQLMSTWGTLSERVLAEVSCEGLPKRGKPRVLIGGLGFGFTLRRVLELVGPKATVHVAELFPEVIAWNREFLGAVNGPMLNDPRVSIFVADVFNLLQRLGKDAYDAILLDVDNGPFAMVKDGNSRLYGQGGFDLITRALAPGGRVAFWSATDEPRFARRLAEAHFRVRTVEVKPHERAKRTSHRIYVAQALEPEPEKAVVENPVRPARRRKRSANV